MQNKSTILVGGVGRSGTSILSRLLATAEHTEFFYEPAIPFYLVERVGEFKNKEEWKKLFEIAVCKDLLKGALSGRNINLNPNDTSSIYKYKTEEEIKQRHKKSYTQFEIDNLIEHTNVVIKLLDNIYKFRQIKELIEGVKAVIIFRNPVDTINSILKKGWFSDEHLKLNGPEPAREMSEYRGFRIHEFIERDFYDKWISMTEIDRVSYYYRSHLMQFIELIGNADVFMVSYDRLIQEPEHVQKLLFDKLALKDGGKTGQVLASIAPTKNTLSEGGYLIDPGEYIKNQNNNVYQKLESFTREFYQIEH